MKVYRRVLFGIATLGTVFIALTIYISTAQSSAKASEKAEDFFCAMYSADPETFSAFIETDLNETFEEAEHSLLALETEVNTRYKGLCTESFHQMVMGNRLWQIAPMAANKMDAVLSVEEVILNRVNPDDEDVYFNFEIKIKAVNQSNGQILQYVEKGQIRLTFENFGYRVNSLKFTRNDLIKNVVNRFGYL